MVCLPKTEGGFGILQLHTQWFSFAKTFEQIFQEGWCSLGWFDIGEVLL
jgi:hypothetical protein